MLSGCRTEFVDTRTEGREDFLEELLVVLVDESFKSGEGDGDVLDAEIVAHLEPRGEEVVVRNEIADVGLAETYNLVVLLLELDQFVLRHPAVAEHKRFLFVG